jgi:hypothetical protein
MWFSSGLPPSWDLGLGVDRRFISAFVAFEVLKFFYIFANRQTGFTSFLPNLKKHYELTLRIPLTFISLQLRKYHLCDLTIFFRIVSDDLKYSHDGLND